MKTIRPSVPSRATFWLWFALAGFLIFGGLGYLVCARARGLLDWASLWNTEIDFAVPGVVCAVLGAAFYQRRLKMRAALQAHEKMLASLASMKGS